MASLVHYLIVNCQAPKEDLNLASPVLPKEVHLLAFLLLWPSLNLDAVPSFQNNDLHQLLDLLRNISVDSK